MDVIKFKHKNIMLKFKKLKICWLAMYACTCTIPYILLKALLPVCMKYIARDESQVANIARSEAECYICHKTFIKSCILSYKRSGSVLSVLLYFILTKVSTKYSSLVILTHSFNK